MVNETFAAASLASLGFLLSLWTLRQSVGGRGLPGCGAESGCDAVTRSRWSRWLGMPVAGPAALLYLAVLGALTVMWVASDGRFRHIATDALLAAAPLLAAAAVWFTGLQWLAVRRFCLYCLMLHGIGVGAAVLIAFRVPGGGRGLAYVGLPPPELALVLAVAAIGITSQVLVKPKTFVVREVISSQLSVASGTDAVASGQLCQLSVASDGSEAQETHASIYWQLATHNWQLRPIPTSAGGSWRRDGCRCRRGFGR